MDNLIPLPSRDGPQPLPSDLERRAAVIADVQAMHQDLIAARETIDQLKADLNREEDRVTMLVEERDRYRSESNVFRTKLVELATSMSNIGLMTLAAQDIVRTVEELNASRTVSERERDA